MLSVNFINDHGWLFILAIASISAIVLGRVHAI